MSNDATSAGSVGPARASSDSGATAPSSPSPTPGPSRGSGRTGPHGADGASGNRARDHLANERTYLAWLRTAIGLLALAAAIARFGSINLPRDKVAVAVCGLLGVLVLSVGTTRFYQVSRDLEAGLFKLSTRSPMAISIAVLVGTLIVLLLLA